MTATSLGMLGVAISSAGLCAIQLHGDEPALRKDLMRRFPGCELLRDDAALADAASRLRDWIKRPGTGAGWTLDPGGTEFQQQVWRVIGQIPHGQVISYGELARRAGRPTAVRAAAGACGANPIPLLIPCHRVVGRGGRLGGFSGGLALKRTLLAREGINIF